MGQPVGLVNDVGLDDTGVTPEFLAEIAGYIFSPQRRDGLHLLIDVGAGTVGIASFNIYTKKADDVFAVFASSVDMLATHQLMKERLAAVRRSEARWDDSDAVPTAGALAQQLGVSGAEIDSADERITEAVAKKICDVLRPVKETHWHNAEAWKVRIPTFLVGGGSACDVYRAAVSVAAKRMKVSLPLVVSDYVAQSIRGYSLDRAAKTRLAVAYGLTLDTANCGQIVLPPDNPPYTPRPGRRHMPDRDELYPK